MNDLGFSSFKQHHHTQLWKSKNAKDTGKGYGVQVESTWYWYEPWINIVEAHCAENANMYGKNT